MRFPSFIRLPRHQKFHYEPRYYDPIKEDIERRTKLAKNQLSNEANAELGERISMQWNRRENQAKKSSIRQLLIVTALITTVVVYFYFGNNGIYGLLGIFALLYFYFKFKKSKS